MVRVPKLLVCIAPTLNDIIRIAQLLRHIIAFLVPYALHASHFVGFTCCTQGRSPIGQDVYRLRCPPSIDMRGYMIHVSLAIVLLHVFEEVVRLKSGTGPMLLVHRYPSQSTYNNIQRARLVSTPVVRYPVRRHLAPLCILELRAIRDTVAKTCT